MVTNNWRTDGNSTIGSVATRTSDLGGLSRFNYLASCVGYSSRLYHVVPAMITEMVLLAGWLISAADYAVGFRRSIMRISRRYRSASGARRKFWRCSCDGRPGNVK